MTKNKLFMMLAMGSVAATLACDDGSGASNSDLSTNDCPIGMFRPVGLDACVFSADDVNGNPLALSDDRCASGTPAIPPSCVSDAGFRSYLATSATCAPNYRYEPGACERTNFGTAGSFTTGFGTAGAGAAGAAGFGVVDEGGAAGACQGGFAGFEGSAGSGAAGACQGGLAGFDGSAGSGAAGACQSGVGGFDGSAGAAGTNCGVAGGND